MESVDLDMEEIFDEDDPDEDIGAASRVLPDLADATQSQENDEEENAEVLARLKDLSKGAAKKVVRRPQPKLDPTRLTGDRGIPILPKVFDKVKFKGKGHELGKSIKYCGLSMSELENKIKTLQREDLSVIMRQMEHWSHRLFPKMPFDEVIERVEKLGSKKEVQTCVKKIRLDIPILANDFVGSDQEEQDVQPGNDKDESEGNVRAEDMWDELLREEEEITGTQSGPSTTRAVSAFQPEPSSSKSPESGNRGYDTPVTPAQIAVASPGGFTPEQLDRIEKNKQMALEKRLKKMGHLTPKPKPVLPGSQTPTGSGHLQAQSSLGSPAPAKVDTRDGSRSPLKSVSQENPVKVKPKATDDSDKEQEKSSITLRGSFAITDSGDELNTDTSQTGTLNTVTSQSEGTMSQVYDKSTSQNVTIVDKFAKNAQHWNSASAGGSDSGLLLGSTDTEISGDIADNTGEQDIDETSDNPMSKTKEFVYSAVKATESSGDCSSTSKETIENIDAKKPLSDGGEEMSENLKTEEMSEIIQNQDWKNQKKLGCETVENSSMDTDEMSEVIEKQGSVNVVLKDKRNLGNEDQHVNDKISKDSGKYIEKYIKQVLKLDVNDHQEKENLNINKVKEMAKNVIVNCKTDMTGDHVDLNDIDFDDELNEEQLMETIDS